MATEDLLPFTVASMVEDVLEQHGKRLNDIDLASRKAEEAALRRNEAAGWLRKTVGVVGGKDLPAEPSDEEFRLGLRSGILLCNVLNKVQPGSVTKVVEMPCDSVLIPDGAALSAYQYFENVRNFLVAMEDMGLPTFEASDLEQGGKTSRVVNCVLALKSYSDRKQGGGNGLRRYGSVKAIPSGKQFILKNSEPFMNSLSRSLSTSDKSLDRSASDPSLFNDFALEHSETGTPSLNNFIRGLLTDKKQEDIPIIVENMLSKVMEEFERRLTTQNSQTKSPRSNGSIRKPSHTEMEIWAPSEVHEENCPSKRDIDNGNSNTQMEETSPSETDIDNGNSNTQIEENCPRYIDNGNSNSQMEENCPRKEDTDGNSSTQTEENCPSKEDIDNGYLKAQIERQLLLVEKQHIQIQALKSTMQATKADMNFLQNQYSEEVNNLGAHLRSLARAASGYQRVLEENRKLYNQVQDLKGNIRVYCRVRPLYGKVKGLGAVENLDEGNITITTPSKYGKEGRKSFTFNKIFSPSATQEEVFSDTQPLIRSVLDGYNVCIFAYGQTGSGKTHTMSGPDVLTPETMGVNYRALNDLFQISEQRKDTILYDVSVQMIEIYNEQVRDLLATDGLNRRLEIRNSSQKGLNVPDANLVPVASTSDVINVMNTGQKNRAVGSTAANERSSRSHSCLTVHVQGRDLSSGATIRGCLHLVDLAGSERADKSEAVGERLKEAQHINKSLSALGDVIASLALKNSHVPYRNSKLTQLLQDSLGGQAKTLMFVHISPEYDAVGETLSTLKFAERVSSVELGAARVNKDSSEVKDLKEQIANLKAALARKEGEPAGSSSPERLRVRSSWSSTGSSPSRYSTFGDQRQQIEEIDNLELKHNSSKPKRKSLDIHDLLRSPPWPPVGNPESKDYDKESVSGDWVDKIMVNKQDGERRDSLGSLDDDTRPLPDMFYQKLNGRNPVITDDSDEVETTTSDSSEQDFHCQPTASKPTNIPNGIGSKLKKPTPKQARSPDLRSSIPAPPSRRLSSSASMPKTGRQALSADGKRKPVSGK